MSWNTQFVFAVQALTLMACAGDTPMNSEVIASSVNTNPVVIRRMLCDLARAKLVTSQIGSGGGFRLRRRPRAISLLDVYRATEADGVFCLRRRGKGRPNPHCPVGRNIEAVLLDVHTQANRAIEDVLSTITVDDLLNDLRLRAAVSAKPERLGL
jgi:Rrf2 family protein